MLEKIFSFLSSLKLAVLVILGLALAMTVATVIESSYDTPTAQYWVYQSWAFYALMGLLALNILCVALSRYPWQKRHIPFLMAHAGILILLFGSYVTVRWGVDGSLRITEGETQSRVELETSVLVVIDPENVKDKIKSISIPWIPPGVKFKPFELSSLKMPYPIQVDQFLSHADPNIAFIPNPLSNSPNDPKKQGARAATPAVRFRLEGGPMAIRQEFWLWQGSPSWQDFRAGPARFSIGVQQEVGTGSPHLAFQLEKDQGLSFSALSSSGTSKKGKLSRVKAVGSIIRPGWKGDVRATVLDWIPDAVASTSYAPARVQYGKQAPPPALHLVTSGATDLWLGLGDRAQLEIDGHSLEVAYLPRRIVLPFGVHLEKFTVEHDQGTLTPAAYSSRVSVVNGTPQNEVVVGMNEPLVMNQFTLYQASYEEGSPRPITSIFTVNYDPGRSLKYAGSLLIVLGAVLMFLDRYRKSVAVNR